MSVFHETLRIITIFYIIMTNDQFSTQLVSIFHDRTLPEQNMLLAGYAAIINHYKLKVPLPTILAAISSKHRKYEKDNWQVFTPRHAILMLISGSSIICQ